MKKCPKCGFYMKENYCVRCGYFTGKSVSNIKKYQKNVSDLELMLKDDYQKIIYNKSLLLIFFLGPLYFCYYHIFSIGFLLIFLEFLFICFFGLLYKGSLFVIISCLFISRMLYVIFANMLIKILLNKKIETIKNKYSDYYKEVLFSYKTHSISYIIVSMLFYLFLIFLLIIIYRTYRGNW